MVKGEIHRSLGGALPDSHTVIQLVNKDGDCYINSILQSLFALLPVQRHLIACQSTFQKENLTGRAEQSVFGYFVRIYCDSVRADSNEIWYEPNDFLNLVFRDSGFQRGVASDAYAFFLFLTNAIEGAQSAINCEWHRDLFQSFTANFHFFVDRASTEANGESYTMDESYYACPLPPARSIEAAIEAWKHPTSMDGMRSERTFVYLPSVFACQISNCRVADGCLQKVFAPLQIQEQLTLNDQDGSKQYELRSAILHKGVDFNGGHYICVFRAAGCWMLGDDADIRGMGHDEVALFLGQGYVYGHMELGVSMVFYERIR
jgi:uncharacterized UBP type Zn finger protein